MPITINTNVAAIRSQRLLGKSTQALSDSFNRLSSGLRINKPSDDAAGLHIATQLKNDARVFSQAIRNVNDAISLFNIAEGAVSELLNIVIRAQELAQQSANGILGDSQRSAIDTEAQALRSEFNRIIAVTEFNGLQLLDGSMKTLDVQNGYDAVSLAGTNLGTSIVGDGTFQAQSSFAIGGSPFSSIAADVNGDGKLDIISADPGPSRLGVYIGNGDGSFMARISYAAGSGPYSVASADLNGDGKLDLISADFSANRLSVLLGNGDGSFKARTSFTAGGGPNTVITVDINGDGKLDLVSADLVANRLSVYLGNGDGSFLARTSFATGAGPYSPVSVDVNGDGKLDLISTDSNSNSVSVFFGNGDGSFLARRSFATANGPTSVISLDVNGDGKLDLVSTDNGSNQLSVLIGNGDGSFLARTSFVTDVGPYSVMSADLNGDGKLDLVSTTLATSSMNVFFGNGDGSFLSRISFATGASSYSLVGADVNGDGVLDLISSTTVLLGNGTSTSALAPFSLRTASEALAAIDRLSAAQMNVSAAHGHIGSNQSRLQTTAANLTLIHENYTSAASQILDVDIAEESARLAANQILQQAGAAILAQANQQPRLALQLLQF